MKKDSPRYEKLTRENRARRILKYLFPLKYKGTRLSDRPDIVSPAIGCEVTNSLIAPIFEITSHEPSLFDGDFYSIKEKVKEMIEDSGKDIPMDEGIHEYERIYLQKLKNLNSGGYQLFEENNLFLFSWLYEEESVMEFLELVEEEEIEYQYTFDYIYLYFDRVLMEINTKIGEYRIFPLEEQEQKSILKRSAWEVRVKTFFGVLK